MEINLTLTSDSIKLQDIGYTKALYLSCVSLVFSKLFNI